MVTQGTKLLSLLALLPVIAYADNGAQVYFFPEHHQTTNNELPHSLQERHERARATFNQADRARLLKQGFACDEVNGRKGQANCAHEEAAARREIARRTQQNHEIAKQRMGFGD